MLVDVQMLCRREAVVVLILRLPPPITAGLFRPEHIGCDSKELTHVNVARNVARTNYGVDPLV